MKTKHASSIGKTVPCISVTLTRLVQLLVAMASLAGSALAQHVITTTAGTGGSIFPTGPITVPAGNKPTFFVIPAPTYSIQNVTVDGVSVGKSALVPLPPVNAPVTITASFVKSLTITSVASGPGTISPAGTDIVGLGGSRTFTMQASLGCLLSSLTVNGIAVVLPTPKPVTFSHTINSITANTSVRATFATDPTKVILTSSAGVGGTISPLGRVEAVKGTSRSYTITPQVGYYISDVKVAGKSVGKVGIYNFSNIQAAQTISATFAKNPTITATQSAGGSITPTGVSIVSYNGSQFYSVTPAPGYQVSNLIINGKTLPGATSYNFTKVVANGSIRAVFKALTTHVFITAKQATGGTITPAGTTAVLKNGNLTYTITPLTGYEISSLIVDGKAVAAAGTYGFTTVVANRSISAVFKQRADYVLVTATAGVGGTISPAGKILVPKGTSPVFTATPNINYRVLDMKVGTVSQGNSGTATVNNIQANATVAATFIKLPIIYATQAVGGKILPTGNSVVPLGGSQTYNINADIGYKLDSLLIDGKVVADTDGIYDFANVTTNHRISAKFSLTTHIVNASSPSGGTIAPSGTLNIAHGKDQSFTITPPFGFKAGIRVEGIIKAQKAAGGTLVYLLKNVRKNTKVEAVYAPIGTQFAGTLGIAPVGLGDTIHVANKSPATFKLLTNGTLGVSGVYFHNVSATKWGQASAGTTENDWTASMPLVPGDNDIWFAAVGTGGQVAWYPTIVTYYPASDFTTPLSPYKNGLPLSTLIVGQATAVTWKLGLLSPAGAVVTLYRVEADNTLTPIGTMVDTGVLPDEIQGDGIFTVNTTITAASSSYLYYRAGVAKPGPVTYYSETKEIWAPPPLTDAQVNTAGEKANNARTVYEGRITAGDTPQEAAEFVAEQMRQDPDIGAVGTTEEGGLWWISKEGILGGYHPKIADSKAGGGAGGPVAERGPAPTISTPDQAQQAAQNPFYSPHDWATMFPDSPPPAVGSILASAAPPPLSTDGKNRIRSDRAVIISPFISNPSDPGSNFLLSDDYFGPWTLIQDHKTCGLYADKAYVNNGSMGVTLDHFKNLSAFGYIHFSTHGDNLYNGLLSLWQDVWGPNDFLKGNLSVVGVYSGLVLPTDVNGKFVKGVYEEDINEKRIAIFPDGSLFLLPKFFKDYVGGLPNSLVMISACRSGYNGSLMSVFLSKGAATTIGFTDYVKSSYAKNTTSEIVTRMYEDKSVLQAMQSAVAKYGPHDGGKPAYLVYAGATDLYFPAGSLSNGGFEDGILEPWERSGDGRIITGLGIEKPKEGKFMGIISTGLGFTTSSGSIQQRVCVPDGGGMLSFRWSMYSEEWLEYVGSQFQDSFTVSVAEVNPTTGVVGAFTPLFSKTVDGLAGQVVPADVGFDRGGVYKTGWRLDTLNFNPYSGKTIVLKFSCTDVGDSIYDSAVLLDDIQFLPGAPPS